jgi:hypothetical protein
MKLVCGALDAGCVVRVASAAVISVRRTARHIA